MDVSDGKVTDEDGFLYRSIDQSIEHHLEGEDLDQSCGQRDCVSTFAAGHWRSVARRTGHCSARGAEFHLEFYQRNVTGGMRSPWTLLFLWCRRVFLVVVKVARNSRTCSLFLSWVSIHLP